MDNAENTAPEISLTAKIPSKAYLILAFILGGIIVLALPINKDELRQFFATTQLNVALHEILSWGVALVSTTLYFVEKRRNLNIPHYMNLQGILRSVNAKSLHYSNLRALLTKRETPITKDEHLNVINAAFFDSLSLVQTLAGAMKALAPDTDIAFDTGQFTFQSPDAKKLREHVEARQAQIKKGLEMRQQQTDEAKSQQ